MNTFFPLVYYILGNSQSCDTICLQKLHEKLYILILDTTLVYFLTIRINSTCHLQ